MPRIRQPSDYRRSDRHRRFARPPQPGLVALSPGMPCDRVQLFLMVQSEGWGRLEVYNIPKLSVKPALSRHTVMSYIRFETPRPLHMIGSGLQSKNCPFSLNPERQPLRPQKGHHLTLYQLNCISTI